MPAMVLVGRPGLNPGAFSMNNKRKRSCNDLWISQKAAAERFGLSKDEMHLIMADLEKYGGKGRRGLDICALEIAVQQLRKGEL